MSEGHPLVQLHGVGDGVEALECDDSQREDTQLRGQDSQKAGHQTAAAQLPRDGVLAEFT